MPAVLVHGNPDTHRVWDPLLLHLRDHEVVALDLPGFGAAPPVGFHATRWEYRDWLLEQIAELDGPIHLVGHDVGGVIVQGVVRGNPEAVASWTIASGIAAPDYAWHRQARIWQTAGLGETWRESWLATPPDRQVAAMVAMGMPREAAEVAVRHYDRTLCDSALHLYRSCAYMGDWSFSLDRRYPPGLVLWGRRDVFQDAGFGRRQAELARASFFALDAGHWWQHEAPREAAELLAAHWQSVGVASGLAA